MAVAPLSRRSGPRQLVALPVTLTRAHGNPLSCRTIDVCAGGMRIATERPLRIDAVFAFDLQCGAGDDRVTGECRVLREDVPRQYAVRFEHLSATAIERLQRLAAGG